LQTPPTSNHLKEKKPGMFNPDSYTAEVIFEIRSFIEDIENDVALIEEKNFDQRVDALDIMEFKVFDLIDDLLLKSTQKEQIVSLKARAEKAKTRLEEINLKLFQTLRTTIQTQKHTGEQFKSLISEYVDFDLSDNAHQQEAGYDNLDIFINGLLCFDPMPEPTIDLEPEMVFYQKTPARIVFEMVEKAEFNKDDVFFDLGSGLGQLGILVNLLTGIRTIGVEFEPAFCDYARDCTEKLSLPKIAFLNTDARSADYGEGTVFFMYTPFKGEIMTDVLEVLRQESLKRKIKIIAYGPCTAQLVSQNWLYAENPNEGDLYKLGIFTSL
jgi:hypothetical protein